MIFGQECNRKKGGDIMNKPFEYSEIAYNEVILYLETKWDRRISNHECQILIEGYRYGRMVEAENEIKILFAE